MRIYRGVDAVTPNDFRPPVAVTVGVFDGVHRGHAKILAELVQWARADHGDAVAVTFDPHPREVLTGQKPAALQSLEHRLVLLARAHVDAVVVLPFNRDTAAIEAEDFVRDLLVGKLGARKVLFGANHRFGNGRRGDLGLLQRLGPELGLVARGVELEEAPPASGRGPPALVSSTSIRDAIREGRLEEAEHLLGRPVSVLGEVVKGDARGRLLGFPTANLDLDHGARPPRGVYACLVAVGAPRSDAPDPGRRWLAVTNVGRRPTFETERGEDLVEVHLLDFTGDLYGQSLEVSFLAKLRDERRFESVAALTKQIAEDVAEARRRFRPLLDTLGAPP